MVTLFTKFLSKLSGGLATLCWDCSSRMPGRQRSRYLSPFPNREKSRQAVVWCVLYLVAKKGMPLCALGLFQPLLFHPPNCRRQLTWLLPQFLLCGAAFRSEMFQQFNSKSAYWGAMLWAPQDHLAEPTQQTATIYACQG